MNDAKPAEIERLGAWLNSSLARGVPVPLYVGGDLVRGVSSAVPRHVVLAVPPEPGGQGEAIALYEPGSARVHELSMRELGARAEPHPALGGWTHVCWALLPRAVGAPAPGARPGTRSRPAAARLRLRS